MLVDKAVDLDLDCRGRATRYRISLHPHSDTCHLPPCDRGSGGAAKRRGARGGCYCTAKEYPRLACQKWCQNSAG